MLLESLLFVHYSTVTEPDTSICWLISLSLDSNPGLHLEQWLQLSLCLLSVFSLLHHCFSIPSQTTVDWHCWGIPLHKLQRLWRAIFHGDFHWNFYGNFKETCIEISDESSTETSVLMKKCGSIETVQTGEHNQTDRQTDATKRIMSFVHSQ